MNEALAAGIRRRTALLALLLLLWPTLRARGEPARTPGVGTFRKLGRQEQLSLSLRIAEARHDDRLGRYFRCLLRHDKWHPAPAERRKEPPPPPASKARIRAGSRRSRMKRPPPLL